MPGSDKTNEVREIMLAFAERTGLTALHRPPRRYLWTDAHAVCNFLSLYRQSGEDRYRNLAIALIDQVHDTLGRHRADDRRKGWISGLDEKEGQAHPTAGGLRIGKRLPERRRDEPFDERLEWDRDGQYFHYLTKWMHALARAGDVTGNTHYWRLAIELAKAAHRGFTNVRAASGSKCLAWKMSIDLSYALVPSSGLHDALDAFITYDELRRHSQHAAGDSVMPNLDVEIAEAAAMIEGQRWNTDDPLGIGGLLFDACRAIRLAVDDSRLVERLLRAALESLEVFSRRMPLGLAAQHRLAFRELGLSIGLRALAMLPAVTCRRRCQGGERIGEYLVSLATYAPLAAIIETFWSAADSQRVPGWLDHLDINTVMLATSLVPDEFARV